MKPLRTHTHAKHRNGAKVAALVAAALLAASSAGCAEVSQTLRGIDNAIAVALGGQPKGGGSSARGNALMQAAAAGDVSTIERLIAGGADVNAHEMLRLGGPDGGNFPGKTALMYAAEGGHLAAVEKLLAAGAKVNAKCRLEAISDVHFLYNEGEGESALIYAVRGGNLQVAERLLAAGANVNEGGYGGCAPETDNCGTSPTPLGLALEQGRGDMADLLLRHKANPNLGLCAAAMEGRTEIVKLLLDKGAKVNYAVKDGINASPLTCAVLACGERDKTETVRLLLGRGANANVKYPSDPEEDPGMEAPSMSVLQYAKRSGCTQIVKLLQSGGKGKKRK